MNCSWRQCCDPEAYKTGCGHYITGITNLNRNCPYCFKPVEKDNHVMPSFSDIIKEKTNDQN